MSKISDRLSRQVAASQDVSCSATPESVGLLFVHLLAVCGWLGGFVAIAVGPRIARRGLSVGAPVGFLRPFGRRYGIVGGLALGVALLIGSGLLSQRRWDEWAVVAVVLALALVVATEAGVAPARGMTRLRP